MQLSIYLTFDGNTREAFTFYQQVLGGELEFFTFGDSPMAGDLPAEHHGRTMHACLTYDGQRLMASDSMPEGICGGTPFTGIQGCSLSLHPTSVAEGERLFAALSEGGQVTMPMDKTFWAERFGMLVDRFGVAWMVNCEQA